MEKTFEQQEQELIAHLEEICPNNNDRLDTGDGFTIYRMEKGTIYDCWQFSASGMNTWIHVREKWNKPEAVAFHRRLLGITESGAVQAERDETLKYRACLEASEARYAKLIKTIDLIFGITVRDRGDGWKLLLEVKNLCEYVLKNHKERTKG